MFPYLRNLKRSFVLKDNRIIYDSKVSKFVSSELVKQEIYEKFNDFLMKLLKNDKFYEIRLSSLNAEKSECFEAAENFDKKNKTLKKKITHYHYLDRQEEPHRNNNNKSLIDFDEEYVTSVYLTTRISNNKIFKRKNVNVF